MRIRSARKALGVVVSTVMLLPASGHAAATLEEIVVTAQKRQESIQDVPIAITAHSAEALERLNVKSILDLGAITPGLITGEFAGYSMIFIRGVGSTVTFVGADASVATYVDGYYLSYISGTNQELYDAERVEVLKGPQAALYGRNASAGAINFVSMKPNTEETVGKFSVGVGSEQESEYKGYLSGPINDQLAYSVAALYRQRDSYIDFTHPSYDQHQSVDNWAARVKLLWHPTESYSAELSLSKSYKDNVEDAVATPLRGSNIEAEHLGATVSYADQRKYSDSSLSENQVEQGLYFLTQELALDGMTLRSLTGVTDTRQHAGNGYDGSTLTILSAYIKPATSKQFSQEFQLLSDTDSSLSWILGGSYFRSKDHLAPTQNFLTFTSQTIGLFNDQTVDSQSKTDTLAVFGELTYAITDRLKVIGGARYTDETKKMPENFVMYNGIPTPSPLFDCAFAGLQFGVNCGGIFGLPAIPPAFVGAGAAALNGVHQIVPAYKDDWQETTYRAVLQYDFSEDVNGYLNFSHGFKSAVFNLPALNPGVANPPVDPEKIDNYEVGMKGDFLDGRLRINAAAFFYDISDLQAQVGQAGGAGTTLLASAGDAEVKGGEIEIFAAPTEKLALNANIAFLDSEYKEFTRYPAVVPSASGGVNGAGGNATVITSVVGNDLVRSPNWTSSASATYTTPLQGGTLSMTVMWSWTDDYCFESACRGVQEAYSIVNASVSYTLPDDHWKLSGWVNNLFDEDYMRSYIQLPTGDVATYSRPVNGGVRVEYSF